MTTFTPSGRQFSLASGRARATVVEVGGGLRSFTWDGVEILDGYSRDEMCHDARGQILMPWPNRLAAGRYSFEGTSYQLPLTEPARGNAIHGLVRWRNWHAEQHSQDRLRMSYVLYASPGYPFGLELSVGYMVDDDGLHVELGSRNIGKVPCPFGAGQHPYVRGAGGSVDNAVLTVPAHTTCRYDDRLIPVERIGVAGGPLDFRSGRRIGSTQINADFTDLDRAADGRAHVIVAEDGSRKVDVWMDTAFRHVTIYTGETVEPASRRRQGIAIEPMTCPPNAFNSGEDLVILQPEQTWQGSWGIQVSG